MLAVRHPDIGATIQDALRDAWPIMRSRLNVYIVLAVITAIIGVGASFAPLPQDQTRAIWRMQLALQPPNLLGAIAAFFVLPALIRTVRPDFRMTFGRVLALIGIAIVYGVCVEVAALFLVIPGIWLATKWSQVAWTYLIDNGKNPFGESWEITTRQFWHTLGFLILVSIVCAVVMLVVLFIPVGIAYAVPLLSVIALPIGFLGYVFVTHFVYLAEMRWALALRDIHGAAPEMTPAPVTA